MSMTTRILVQTGNYDSLSGNSFIDDKEEQSDNQYQMYTQKRILYQLSKWTPLDNITKHHAIVSRNNQTPTHHHLTVGIEWSCDIRVIKSTSLNLSGCIKRISRTPIDKAH